MSGQPQRLDNIQASPGNITLNSSGSAFISNYTAINFRRGIMGFQGQGNQPGVFELWINGTPTYFGQTTTTEVNTTLILPYPHYLEIGSIAQLKVTNNTGGSSFYEGCFFYL